MDVKEVLAGWLKINDLFHYDDKTAWRTHSGVVTAVRTDGDNVTVDYRKSDGSTASMTVPADALVKTRGPDDTLSPPLVSPPVEVGQ